MCDPFDAVIMGTGPAADYLIEHFDVEPSTFHLAPANHAQHEAGTH